MTRSKNTKNTINNTWGHVANWRYAACSWHRCWLPQRLLKSQALPKSPIHAPAVQKLDSDIHRINHCPVNSAIHLWNNWGQNYTNPEDHVEVWADLPDSWVYWKKQSIFSLTSLRLALSRNVLKLKPLITLRCCVSVSYWNWPLS